MVATDEIWKAKEGGQRIEIKNMEMSFQGLRMWWYLVVGSDFIGLMQERRLLEDYELDTGDDSGSTGGTTMTQGNDSPTSVREPPTPVQSDAESEESEEMYDWREPEPQPQQPPDNNHPWRADPYWKVLFESIRATSVVYGRNQTEDEIKELADSEYWLGVSASHRASEFKDPRRFGRFSYKDKLKF